MSGENKKTSLLKQIRAAKKLLTDAVSVICEAEVTLTYDKYTPWAVPAERLEPVWNKLFGFLSRKRFLALLEWGGEIGYTYYSPSQKSPIDLCEYIRDHLRDLNEERFAELEAILE